MPKLNVQQNNQNVIQAFKNALAIGNLKGIIASDGSHNFSTAGSNRNLLDNPFFQVNQRGWTSGTANAAFTVDRWKMSSAYGTKQVTVNADGTITFDGLFFQKFEPHFIAGQVVTISYMTADMNVVSTTGTIGTTEGYAVGNAAFGLYYRPSTGVCDFQIQADNLTLRACKVELGSVSTLANDAPPDYGTELAKCQRYYYRITGVTFLDLGAALAETATAWLLRFPLPVPMRVAPTTAVSGNFVLWNGSAGNACSGISTHTAVTPPTNPAYVAIKGTSTGMTVGNRYNIQARNQASAYIEFSADL